MGGWQVLPERVVALFGSCGVCVMLGYCGFDSGCRHVVIVGS